MLKFRGARVLLDERGLAAPLLDRVRELDLRGPTPITDDDRQMRIVWAKKMVERAKRGDLEAHYRTHWLLFQLLEDYYALRGRWYRGPKEAFATMEPTIRALFERALAPGAPMGSLVALVAAVAT